jgi:MFS family permease
VASEEAHANVVAEVGMPARARHLSPLTQGFGADFWRFWTGQAISKLGSSFTSFALPLLVYKLTHSALNLAYASVAAFLPYLLFGLLIGVWLDRADRKRWMIASQVASALVIALIPLLAVLHLFVIEWVYAVQFVSATLAIGFDFAQAAAIPSLVSRDDLVRANGSLRASYAAASALGPLLAGLLVFVVALPMLLLFDAASFLVSAISVALIRRSLNAEPGAERPRTSVRQDIAEGLRYVLRQPVVRNIALLAALANFVLTTRGAQAVLFAKQQLHASDAQVGVLFSAGNVGVVVFSLAAGPLRRRLPFGTVLLGATMLLGLLTVALALTRWCWLGVLLWAVTAGLLMVSNITQISLRQAIVPSQLLGRVTSAVNVLAQLVTPVGLLLGGLAIQWTGSVALVYGAIGGLMFLAGVAFSFTALAHAEWYLPQMEAVRTP